MEAETNWQPVAGRRAAADCPLPPEAAKPVRLLAQAELLDEVGVARAVDAREVAQQAIPLADEEQQAATAGVILAVGLEVGLERVDALREERDLDLRRTRVVLVTPVRGNGRGLGCGRGRHCC